MTQTLNDCDDCEQNYKITDNTSSFEEIEDCDDCNDNDIDNYEIEVIDNNTQEFLDINKVNDKINHVNNETKILKTKFSLETWWPEVAQHIIDAMYSSKENKRVAISKFMEIFELEKPNVQTLRMQNEEINKLSDLYRMKLQLFDKYLTELKNVWCDILKKCATDCKNIIDQKSYALIKLKSSANNIFKKKKHLDDRIGIIIDEEYKKTLTLIINDFDMKLKIAKHQRTPKTPFKNEKFLSEIDQSIEKYEKQLLKMYEITHIEEIKNVYHSECELVEWEIANKIKSECQHHWMNALT